MDKLNRPVVKIVDMDFNENLKKIIQKKDLYGKTPSYIINFAWQELVKICGGRVKKFKKKGLYNNLASKIGAIVELPIPIKDFKAVCALE